MARPELYRPPDVGEFLPGGGVSIVMRPDPAIRLKDSYLLHAVITRVLGVGHRQVADWSLLPWSESWGAWIQQPDLLAKVAGKVFRVDVGRTHDAEIRFGPALKIKAPVVGLGRHRLAVTALSPVVCRASGKARYTSPGASTLASTLSQNLARRLGLDIAIDELELRVLSKSTEPRNLRMGTLGDMRGWVGDVELEANPPAAWLLHAAARGPGLGGRTAFGFGRIVCR